MLPERYHAVLAGFVGGPRSGSQNLRVRTASNVPETATPKGLRSGVTTWLKQGAPVCSGSRRECALRAASRFESSVESRGLRLSLTDEGNNGCTTGMASESGPRAPLDEAAALEELERFQRSIEEWRRRRNDVQAEFDRFVRGFRMSALAAATAEPPAITPGSNSPAVQSPAAAALDAPIIAVSPAAPAKPATATDRDSDEPVTPPPASVLEPADSLSPAPPATVKSHFRSKWSNRPRLFVLAIVLVVLAAVGALLTGTWQSAPGGSSGSIQPTPAVRQNPQPDPQPASSPQRAAPAEVAPPRSEILAVRRVWVRIVVDGVKTTERELQAGERVPLPAGSAAAIRAGNAGALQVTINGEDRGSLGAEGEVVTRTLQIPAPPVR